MKLFSARALVGFAGFLAVVATAQETPAWEVQALNQIIPGTVEGKLDYDMANGTAKGTNGVFVKYGTTTLTADSGTLDTKSGEMVADGHVRIESADQLWIGDHIRYNFKTHQMQSESFRTGRWPVFVGGTDLTGNSSNRVFVANHAYVTTDDAAEPAFQVRASRIKIISGKVVQMWNAVFYVNGVPVFYFPYYQRNLGARANNFTAAPGFRSSYGAFLLNTYRWYLGDDADGKLHLDYRSKRGVGFGPDVNLRLDQWGQFGLSYYYAHDIKANYSTNSFPQYGAMPENRQRLQFTWQAEPATNLELKTLVNYQSDPLVLHDFFQGDYAYNPQPNSFVEAEKHWNNWSLDALTTPRINSFYDQVERLPDVKLTAYRQQVFDTPVYYDGESSFGYYQAFDSNATGQTNGLYASQNGSYTNAAARGDTYHQLTLPWTFFNWLNVTPRVGGRLTYYSEQNRTNATPNRDLTRAVFNTGVSTSFKASQLWAGATNSLLQVNGLRHIIEPSVNYVYVPKPSQPPGLLPQFDADQPSLMLRPVNFTDYNNIDSIDAQNVLSFGLRNTLQTKRDGQLDDLLSWNLLLDCRLDPLPGQNRLNDLYSAIAFKPRTWLIAESQNRYDLQGGNLNLSFEQLTLAPNDRWSWGVGYWFLRGGNWGGNNWIENQTVTSTVFVRFDDNWGGRMTHNFNAVTGRLHEQFYSLYRDLRSWTAALTFRVVNDAGRDPDYTIAVTFSLKASPTMKVGEDVANRFHLVGE